MRRVTQAEHRRAIAMLHRLADKAMTRALSTALAPLTARVNARAALTASALDELDTFPSAWAQVVDDELLPMLEETFGLGALGAARQLRDAVDIRGGLTMLVPLAQITGAARQRWLTNAQPELFKLGDDVWAKAKAQLLEGIRLGESTDLLAARLADVVELATPLANSVARSMAVASANAGGFAEVAALGEHGPEGKQWQATADGRTRDSHDTANGQIQLIGDPFEVGSDLLDYPGDFANGSPEEVFNCRCTTLWVQTVGDKAGANELESITMQLPADDTEAIAAAAQPCGCSAAHDCGCHSGITAAAEVHTGGMVALVPTDADAQRLAVDGYEPADVLHCTLAFLGDGMALPEQTRAEVTRIAQQLAADTAPIIANAHGVALFNAASDEPCSVYLLGDVDLDATPLATVHDILWDGLADLDDVFPDQHSPHVPHIAIAYSDASTYGMEAEAGQSNARIRGDDPAMVGGGRGSEWATRNELPSVASVAFEGLPIGGDQRDFLAAQPSDSGLDDQADSRSRRGGSSSLRGQALHSTGASGSSDDPRTRPSSQGTLGVRHSPPSLGPEEQSRSRSVQTMQQRGVITLESRSSGAAGEESGPGTGAATENQGSPFELLGRLTEAGTQVTFDRLRVAFGQQITDIPLTARDAVSASGKESEAMSITDEQAKSIGEGIGVGILNALSTTGTVSAKNIPATGNDATATVTLAPADTTPPVAPTPPAPAPDAPAADPAMTVPEEFHILMVTEEQATLEKPSRYFMAQCFEWREPPFPLMWLNTDTHSEGSPDPSVEVGLITRVERQGLEIHGWGHWDDPINEDAAEARRRVDNQMLQWNSVDIGDVGEADIEMVFPPPGTLAPDGIEVMEPEQIRFHHGRLVLSTLVFSPAQENAVIEPLIFADGSTEPPAPAEQMNADELALVAAAYPMTIPDIPDASWFVKPPLEALRRGALTITDEGRVYGLLAPGAVPHVGLAERTTVPLRNVEYRDFLRGETPVRLADGSVGRIVTGNLTMACGHASKELPNGATQEHYDNSCSLFATAVCGEAHGDVWIAGALLPGVEPDQVRRAMACQLSGHWNPHELARGRYSLLAGLLVPIPGFPKGRTQATATSRWGPNEDGDLMLVASAVPVVFEQSASARPALSSAAERIAKSIGQDRRSRAQRLAARVKVKD